MSWKRGNRLKLVAESEAPAPTRRIFDEVRNSLGIPVVPKLYQAYAAFPEFLELHWQAFRPALETRHFFLLGARLAPNRIPERTIISKSVTSRPAIWSATMQALYLCRRYWIITSISIHCCC